MADLADFVTTTANFVRDEAAHITGVDANVEECVYAALVEHNLHKPQELIEDFTGDGTKYYPLTGGSAVLASFDDDWDKSNGSIRSVEYPVPDLTQSESPSPLTRGEQWRVYRDEDTVYLWFATAPQTTDDARVTYTVPWAFVADSVATPAPDFYPLCYLAASLVFEELAGVMTQGRGSATMVGDGMNWMGRPDLYAAAVKRMRERYDKHVGLVEDAPVAAGIVVHEIDSHGVLSSTSLFHGNR